MNSHDDILDHIQTTSPCSTDWASMSGNNQVRFCSHCNLSVYNISGMTRKEAKALVTQSRGQLCAKYFRRVDGSVLTADQPDSLGAINARVITGAFTVLLTISSNAIGQSLPKQSSQSNQLELSVQRNDSSSRVQAATLKGSIVDPNEALIPRAKITLISESNRDLLTTFSNQEGEFRFISLPAGVYSLTVEAAGFSTFAVQHLRIKEGDELRVDARMQIGMPVCEVVEIQGSGGDSGDNVNIGTIGIMHRKGFWQKLLEVVTFPYKQGKKILTH